MTEQLEKNQVLIYDELQSNHGALKKNVDGVRVTLHHWKKTNNHHEQWYVEIELGGAIPTRHFKDEKSARICYESINHTIASYQKEIFSMQQKISELRIKVDDMLSMANFEQRPLREDEV